MGNVHHFRSWRSLAHKKTWHCASRRKKSIMKVNLSTFISVSCLLLHYSIWYNPMSVSHTSMYWILCIQITWQAENKKKSTERGMNTIKHFTLPSQLHPFCVKEYALFFSFFSSESHPIVNVLNGTTWKSKAEKKRRECMQRRRMKKKKNCINAFCCA